MRSALVCGDVEEFNFPLESMSEDGLKKAMEELCERVEKKREVKRERRRLRALTIAVMLWMWQRNESPFSALPFELMRVIVSHV